MSITIINRDLGEHAGAIGVGLTDFATNMALAENVQIITSSNSLDLVKLSQNNKIQLSHVKSMTSSNSNIFMRLLETFYFSIFVILDLCKTKPKIVYVTSNPPIIIPFLVYIFCSFYKAKYIYHVQDIHPEATNIILKLPRLVIRFFKYIDTLTLKNADVVITLNQDMKNTLLARAPAIRITLLDNPAVKLKLEETRLCKINGAIFCGNAGRLQHMEVLLDAIDTFLTEDTGDFVFAFVGRGIYSERLAQMAKKHTRFKYYGYVSATEALRITSIYKWALLPIVGEVLKYANPSKLPTYIAAECQVISIVSKASSLANIIKTHNLGFNLEPTMDDLIEGFRKLSQCEINFNGYHEFKISSASDFGTRLTTIANSI